MDTELKKKIWFGLDILMGSISLIALICLVLLAGFRYTPEQFILLKLIVDAVTILFIAQEGVRWFLTANRPKYARTRWLENLFAILLFVHLIFEYSIVGYFSGIFPELAEKDMRLIYLGLIQFSIFFIFLIKAFRYNHLIGKLNLHPGAIFALSFAFIILIGSLLLMLPNSTPDHNRIRYIDALFTSTSAVCVTGLTAVDTAKDFTVLGKSIILMLIQVGGLGVMTLSTFFAALFAGGISIRVRVMMKDLLSEENLSGVTSILIKISLFTFAIEAIGALLLYVSLGGSLPLNKEFMYVSVFHSISAFCNAGFSLYSSGLVEAHLQNNYLFTSTIMLLIVLGGISFGVLSNLYDLFSDGKKFKRLKHRFRISTKIILITTVSLIAGGAFLMYFAESFSYYPQFGWFEKVYHSIFLSVTARTAGFNTVPTEKLSNAVVMLLIVLMWIGASPNSTGGGIKTTTFALMVLALYNQIRGKERVEAFHRRIETESIHRSFLVASAALFVLCVGSIMLVWIEPDKNAIDLIFEATSALGTVGLSRNLTFFIGDGGKSVLIALMFIGRIGALTFFLAFIKPQPEPNYKLPIEKIVVG